MVKNIVTHNGAFHADDVFAVATLNAIYTPLTTIERIPNFKASTYSNAGENILVDIGGGDYDHHGTSQKYREDGIPFASFGLVWRDFGKEFLSKVLNKNSDWLNKEYIHSVNECQFEALVEYVHQKLDERLVREVDACDNGVVSSLYSISNTISAFNPDWTTDIANQSEYDDKFVIAMDFAFQILKRESIRLASNFSAQTHVKNAYKNGREIIILHRFLPWKETLLEIDTTNEAKFVVYPSKNGYDIVAVPPSAESPFEQRVPFPQEWRGKSDMELASVCEVTDAVFCHNGGFQCAAKTLEGALSMANRALEYSRTF